MTPRDRSFDLSETIRTANLAPPTAATLLLPDLAAGQLHAEAIQALERLELDFAENCLREALALALPRSLQGKLLTVEALVALAQVRLLKANYAGAEECYVGMYALACDLRRADWLQVASRGKALCDLQRIRTAELTV